MVYVALAFGAGIGLPLWLGVILLAGAGITRRIPRPDWILLLGCLLLGQVVVGVDRLPERGTVARWASSSGSPVTLEGTLVSEAEYGPSGQPPRGWLRVERIQQAGSWTECHDKLQVNFPRNGPEFFYGDRLRFHGQLRSGRASSAPHRFSEKEWLQLEHAEGVLRISEPEGVELLEFRPTHWIRYRRRIGLFRRGLRMSGREFLDPEPAGLLEGLLLGEGRGISPLVWESFRRTGTVHVLVVSGLHVGLLVGIQGMLLGAIGLPRKIRCILLAFLMISYCLLCGANPPIVRATLAGFLLCWAWAAGLAPAALNFMGAAALFMLLFDPRLLADAGFQLSFASVSAVLWTAGRLRSAEEMGFLRRWLIPAVVASAAAWVVTTPILVWHFRSFSWIAPLANLVVVPWTSFLIALGFLVYASCVFAAPAAPLFGALFSQTGKVLITLVDWMAGLLLM